MAFPLFKDVGKSANDLLKKGYVSTEKYAFRVEAETTSSSGIQVNPFMQATTDRSIEGEVKTKFPVKDFQLTTTAHTKQDLSLEIAPRFPSSLHSETFKWSTTLSTNLLDFFEKLKGKATLEYRNEFTTTAVSGESTFRRSTKPDESPKLNFSSVFGSKDRGVSAGIDTEISVASQQLKTINSALSYSTKDLDVTIFSKTKIGGTSSTIVGTNFYQRSFGTNTNDTHIGGEISYDLKSNSPSFLLGVSSKPTSDSTTKARFDSKGILGFSYTEKWGGPLSITFMSDWNVYGSSSDSPFQYGLKLAFK